jgi:outer membrane cobalamin receptor
MPAFLPNTTLLLICLLAFTFPVLARENPLGIYIVNVQSKLPVEDAFVQSEDGTFAAIANEQGFVSFADLSKTILKLQISRIGFEPKSVEFSNLPFSGNTAIVYLQAKVSTLNDVQVRASAPGFVFKSLTDLDIQLRPINNSQDILRMVPGLFTGQHAGGGKAEQIFLRGFDADHGTDINITVDGIPVNMVSHAHGQGYADLHFLIPELIDKVNFNKGPYTADKGNFATAGFVEFKTKDLLDNNFVKLEAGQFGTFRGVTGINLLKPEPGKTDQGLYVAGEASYTRGYFDSPQDFNRFNGIIKYYGKISNHHTITTSLTGFSSKWNASGQIPVRAVESGLTGFYGAIDNTEGGKTSRYNASAVFVSRLNNGGSIRQQIFYSRYTFELYSNFTFFREDPVNGDQVKQKETRNLYGYNGSYQKEFFLGHMKTETKAGVQFRYDDIKDIELTRTKDRVFNTEKLMLGDIDEMNAGGYASQRIFFTGKLHVTGSLRVDYFSSHYYDKLKSKSFNTSEIFLSPKLNFTYRMNDKVQFFLNNGRGFHSNDKRAIVFYKARKLLPPAYGSDIGGIFKAGSKLLLQSALWYLWLEQELIYVGDEAVVEAGGQTRRMGLDFSARYELAKNLFTDLDISVANPKKVNVEKAASYLPLAPRFTSTGGFTYKKETGWNGSLRYRYMGDRPANENNSVIAKGYFIADASTFFTTKKWEAGISIQNLFNSKWKETQFDTESRLQNETAPVSEIHFTAGTPFFAKASFTIFL